MPTTSQKIRNFAVMCVAAPFGLALVAALFSFMLFIFLLFVFIITIPVHGWTQQLTGYTSPVLRQSQARGRLMVARMEWKHGRRPIRDGQIQEGKLMPTPYWWAYALVGLAFLIADWRNDECRIFGTAFLWFGLAYGSGFFG